MEKVLYVMISTRIRNSFIRAVVEVLFEYCTFFYESRMVVELALIQVQCRGSYNSHNHRAKGLREQKEIK